MQRKRKKQFWNWMIIMLLIVSLIGSTFTCVAADEGAGGTADPSSAQTQNSSGQNTEQGTSDSPQQSVDLQPPETIQVIQLTAPEIKSWIRISQTEMELSWTEDPKADGYEIQYTKDQAFSETGQMETMTVEDASLLTARISDLEPNVTYFVRIRSYKVFSDTITYHSDWSVYTNGKKDRTASPSMLKRNGQNFELNGQLGSASANYDVLQGSCTDGQYAYYVLYSKRYERCKIAKFRMSDNRLIKVSGVLKLNHGNDMTYNSKLNRLVVVHYSNAPKRLTLIDPETLTVEKDVDVQIPASLPGASESTLKGIKGFSAVAYSSGRDQYVVRIIGAHDYLILDGAMNPVRYVKVSRYNSDLNQGIDATNDYILDVQSKKTGAYNTVTAYDWDGNYLFKINVSKNYEIESVFHVGETLYAGFYRSYYRTYYTTHYKTYKVKWKKVKGKWKYKTKYRYKTVKYKVKWKKVRGKWKYKTKRKKVRVTYQVAHKQLVRCNYVYQIGSI